MSDIVYINHPCGEGSFANLGPAIKVDPDRIEPVALPNAQIHNGLFEVPYRAALSMLLPSLHPATPAYGSLMFVQAPESPIGAFDFALFGVACRSGIRPRILTLAAYASSQQAADLLATYGISAKVATFDTRNGYDATVSTLSIEGSKIAEMSTLMTNILLGSTRAIRYPQPLVSVELGDKEGLLQFDMSYEYDEAWRGPLSLRSFDAHAFGNGSVAPTDLMGGTVSKINIVLQPPRLLLDPLEVGQVTKLDRKDEVAA